MSPSERLKEIERLGTIPGGECYACGVRSEEQKWLIDRIRKLEKALEFYAKGEHQSKHLSDFNWQEPEGYDVYSANECIENGLVARQALEKSTEES